MTRPDGIVLDAFHVADPDYRGMPPPDRPLSIAETDRAACSKGTESVENARRPQRTTRTRCASSQPIADRPKSASTMKRPMASTIIDAFADDRQGLLYVITHAMFQLGLSVHAVTHFDATRPSRRCVLCDGSACGQKLDDPRDSKPFAAGLSEEIDRKF